MQRLSECIFSYAPFLWRILLMYNPKTNLTAGFCLFFLWFVWAWAFLPEKVCCMDASPAGEGSFSSEGFKIITKRSPDALLWWIKQRHIFSIYVFIYFNSSGRFNFTLGTKTVPVSRLCHNIHSVYLLVKEHRPENCTNVQILWVCCVTLMLRVRAQPLCGRTFKGMNVNYRHFMYVFFWSGCFLNEKKCKITKNRKLGLLLDDLTSQH